MNRLRRAIVKKPPPSPQTADKKDKEKAPKDKPPGHEDFKRAVNALWGQALLTLAARADEEETWE